MENNIVLQLMAVVGCVLIGVHLFLIINKTIMWVIDINQQLDVLEHKYEFLDKRYYALQDKIRDCNTKTMPVANDANSQ